jgi:hypothetical protein
MPLRKYDSTEWTYGFEWEVGDVSRKLEIPKRFGRWESAETDVLNLHHPYKNVAADPLGIQPPYGGEINTVPTLGWREQVDLVRGLHEWFVVKGFTPTSSCLAHSHIHVHIPGLRDDIKALKRLTEYIIDQQDEAIRLCYQYREIKCGKVYLKWDGGRPMPKWMGENIIKYAKTFDDFIRLQCCGKDAKSMGRPFRYAINTYCLKHIDTIEFRLFRGFKSFHHLTCCFQFVHEFMKHALGKHRAVAGIIKTHYLTFPPMRFSIDEIAGWKATKYNKTRGKKERRYVEVG